MNDKPARTVVAALIQNDKGEYLIFKRPMNKLNPGLWEFVGGKVEEGESLNEALIRECREEIEVEVEPLSIFTQLDHDYPEIHIHLVLINSRIVKGEPILKEHLDCKWVLPENFDNFQFCPADYSILEMLKENKPES